MNFQVYLKPFDASGVYEAEWIDVTRYVAHSSLGSIETALDASDFQLGVFRNSSVTLEMDNREGKFSDVDGLNSLFQYKRTDTQVRIVFNRYEVQPICGAAICGEVGSATFWEPIEIFRGLITEEGLTQNIKKDSIIFTALGLEGILSRVLVPYGSVSVGDLTSAVIYKCLNQTQIKSVLTIDQANISVGLDQDLDSISGLQNKTVKEAIDILLLVTNSILVVEDSALFVNPRTPTADVKHVFRGQGSELGPETITDLADIKNGLSRTFNYFSWSKNPAAVANDSTSSTRYGVKKKELSADIFTADPTTSNPIPNTVKQTAVLNSLLSEFSMPKRELTILTPAETDVFQLKLLDRVAIDHPIVYVANEYEMPICGEALYGESVLPDALWSFELSTETGFKIISRKIYPKRLEAEFRLREI